MKFFLKVLVMLLTLSVFVSCKAPSSIDASGEITDSANSQISHRVNWAAVSPTHNPETEEFDFDTTGSRKISINLYGFKSDVEAVYSNKIQAETVKLKLFKVRNQASSLNNVEAISNGQELKVGGRGNYDCAIQLKGGMITFLRGDCLVRLQVFLPMGSTLEVYNQKAIITRKF